KVTDLTLEAGRHRKKRTQLSRLGIADPRYPIRTTPGASVVSIPGPPPMAYSCARRSRQGPGSRVPKARLINRKSGLPGWQRCSRRTTETTCGRSQKEGFARAYFPSTTCLNPRGDFPPKPGDMAGAPSERYSRLEGNQP